MYKWPARQSEKYKMPIKQHARPATEAIMMICTYSLNVRVTPSGKRSGTKH